MKILLVEPDYYTRYPPVGLLKLATYHKNKGDSVELVRGCVKTKHRPNIIYVTSLFTWTWEPVWQAVKYYKNKFPKAKVYLGGIYASLMPKHAKLSGADRIHVGILKKAENLIPAYDLIPEWDGSIISTSKGCDRGCPFCAVQRIEGKINSCKNSIKKLIYPKHTRIVLWDNNFLQNPHWKNIMNELIESKKLIDFNQGVDARLINEDFVEKLSKMKLFCIRIAYDSKEVGESVKEVIKLIKSHGIRGRNIGVYVLYNFLDSPDDFFERVRNILKWGAVVFPMRFQPLDTLKRNEHIGPKWDKEKLETVAKFKRIYGFGGVFPPYKWLVNRFSRRSSFDSAFQLPEKHLHPKKIVAHKEYFSSWRREKDWRDVTNNFLSKRW